MDNVSSWPAFSKKFRAFEARGLRARWGALGRSARPVPAGVTSEFAHHLAARHEVVVLDISGARDLEPSWREGLGDRVVALDRADGWALDADLVVMPCVSPWGYEVINRWNPRALDPNRSFVEQSLEEHAHRRHWRAQLVRDRRQELVLGIDQRDRASQEDRAEHVAGDGRRTKRPRRRNARRLTLSRSRRGGRVAPTSGWRPARGR